VKVIRPSNFAKAVIRNWHDISEDVRYDMINV